MTLSRRRILHLAGASATFIAAPRIARAQAYPARPVKVIVGQAAGSASDIVARLFSQWWTERLGQQFIVETRPGAGGNIATEFVTRAPADGYTIMLVNSQNTINVALHEKLPFDLVRDIAPIVLVERVPLIMEVHPSVPANTVPEFIAYAKANPGKINMGSAGIGGPQHLSGELFKHMAGVDLTHVPYRGTTPAITDLVAGQIQVMFDVSITALPQINSGKLRPLAVTTVERLPFLPDVPTVGSFVKGYEAVAWIGFGAPKGTPREVIDRLNKETNAALRDETIKKRIIDLGAIIEPPNSPEEFGKYIVENIEKWRTAMKAAGMKPISSQ